MAHGVGVVTLSGGDKSTSYSKHAGMAVAYQLVLVHWRMTRAASSMVATRRRKIQSRGCTGGTRSPLGWSDESESYFPGDDCDAMGHAYVYGPHSELRQENCREASWG